MFAQVLFTTILIVAASIWIGGYVAAVVASIVSSKVLAPKERVAFFQQYGKVFLAVALPALLVAYATGWSMLARLPWSAQLTRMAVASVAILVVLFIAVLQARGIAAARQAALQSPDDAALAQDVERRVKATNILRALLGVFTLGLVVNVAIVLVG